MSESEQKIFLIDPESKLQSLEPVLESKGSLTKVSDPNTLSIPNSDEENSVLVGGEGMDPSDLGTLLNQVGSDGRTLRFFLAVGTRHQLEQPGWKDLEERASGVLILTSSNEELGVEFETAMKEASPPPSEEATEALKLLENFDPNKKVSQGEEVQTLLDTLDGSDEERSASIASRKRKGSGSRSSSSSSQSRPTSTSTVSDPEVLREQLDQNPDAFLESLLQEMEGVQKAFEGIEISSEIVGDIGVETVSKRRDRMDKEASAKEKPESSTGPSGFDENFMEDDPLESRIEKMESGTLGDEDLSEPPDDMGEELGKKKGAGKKDSKISKEVYPRKRRPNDPYLKIIIPPDLLDARMVLYPHDSDLHQSDEIKAELEKQGVVYGVNTAAIEQFLRQVNERREPVLGEIIAKGKPPLDAQDAQVDFEFELDNVIYLDEDVEGRIDYRDMYKIDCVEAGDLLATICPATEPEDGISVFGEPIVGKVGKESRIVAARNVRYDANERKFYAETAGQPCVKGIKLTVLPVYTVPHDVDYSTGNIDFLGTVIVAGNVAGGFRVRASEDVRVMGVVEGAVIHAGGEVFVKRGFVGGDRGKILAKKKIVIRHGSSANLYSESDIYVEDSLLNCDVTCKGKVRVIKGKGSIIGGTIRAVKGIECLLLGAEIGTNTNAVVGEHFLTRRMLNQVNDQMQEQQKKINETQNGIELFSSSLGDKNLMSPDQMLKVKQLKEKLKKLQDEQKGLQKKKDELMKSFKKKCLARVLVRSFAHPGVIVRTGNAVLKLQDKAAHCSFYEDPNQVAVKVGPFERRDVK